VAEEGENCRISNTECRRSKVWDAFLPYGRRWRMSVCKLLTSAFDIQHWVLDIPCCKSTALWLSSEPSRVQVRV